jgi:Fe-S oxidoreductase
MDLKEVLAYTEKCFNGEPASCTFACPFHLDIRSFLGKLEKGRWRAAYKELRNAVVFPVVVSALCPMYCGEHCQRAQTGDMPLALSELERAVLRQNPDRRGESYVIPDKNGHIAVIGAGASGLAAAINLARKKFRVTVYERGDGWGGSLRGHENFSEFGADFDMQFAVEKVDFRFNTEVSSLDALAEYDAIVVATGVGGDDFGLLPGFDEKLLSTENPRVFLVGTLTGVNRMEGIAHGAAVSLSVEVFLQTGKTSATFGGYDKSNCTRYLDHADDESFAYTPPISPEGFTADEARREASRCLKCDCESCMTSCEMLALFKKRPQQIATQVYSDMGVVPPYSSHTLTRETYSCNMCGYCESVCPTGVNVGDVIALSRRTRLKSGDAPAAFHDYWLREMDFSVGDASYASPGRGKSTCEYLFFPGCQLGAIEPRHVLRSYEFLRDKYDAGVYLGCCGAPAHWAGDVARQTANFDDIRAVWERYGKPVFVTACATCESAFADFLPEIETVSIYELLAADGGLHASRVFENAAVFDPCAARGDSKMRESVRAIALSGGVTLSELPEQHRCCGYGGHMSVANPALYDVTTKNRAELSALPYLVYCANCRDVFASHGKSCAHILDAAFSLDTPIRTPRIDEKRKNSIEVKREIMRETGGEFTVHGEPWENLRLVMTDELADELDAALISADDVREAIYLSERGGSRFVDVSDGSIQCSMVKKVLTYWVRYRPRGDGGYEVLDAYYHRMSFDGES